MQAQRPYTACRLARTKPVVPRPPGRASETIRKGLSIGQALLGKQHSMYNMRREHVTCRCAVLFSGRHHDNWRTSKFDIADAFKALPRRHVATSWPISSAGRSKSSPADPFPSDIANRAANTLSSRSSTCTLRKGSGLPTLQFLQQLCDAEAAVAKSRCGASFPMFVHAARVSSNLRHVAIIEQKERQSAGEKELLEWVAEWTLNGPLQRRQLRFVTLALQRLNSGSTQVHTVL